jgi:hypothetical protein
MSAFLFLVVAAGIGTSLYLMVMFSSIPGAIDERLGTLEALPETLGKWLTDTDSEQSRAAEAEGLRREVRLLHQPVRGLFGRECLIEQVRYRRLSDGEIERVDPERRITRKRTKPPNS